MADIIRLRGTDHEQVELLLPWYVNGTLSPDETAQVKAHLDQCDECRAGLAAEQALATGVAHLPLDVERGWSSMSAQLFPAPPRRSTDPVPFLRRRVSILWAAAGPLAAAAAVVAIVALPTRSPPDRAYVALGSNTVAPAGNVVVMFKSDTSEHAISTAMTDAAARIVDGPTTSGAYVLRVAPGSRQQVIERLRELPAITLAEPIDAGVAQ